MHGLEGRAELDAAAVEALDAFHALGVRCLLLKGAALSRLLYTPGEYRGYSDVDLLVAPDDLSAARRALCRTQRHQLERARRLFGSL